ncbi:50S ribosomal protein L4 [Candidatus Woesearchaeota archaeon]|nr:50S ribosomal protein L4 [Candidatus Woesearchaeota archaeon]
MKLKILSIDGSEKGNLDLPKVFNETVRKDLIKRAVTAIEANNRQAYGAKSDAGMRASAKLSRRRHDYRGAYGHGISRVPRKIISRRGTRFNWIAAVAPGVVGGRRAHPPKSEKILDKKINSKENKKAIRSALAATLDKEMVAARGHNVPNTYPFIADDALENVSKTKELKAILVKLGFADELLRTQEKKIRAGRGKSRGRRFKEKRGLLLVTGSGSKLLKSSSNIPGFEAVSVNNLNTSLLAPGGEAGRMVILTKNAIETMDAKKLFSDEKVKITEPKKESKKTASAKKASQINKK